MFGYLIEHKSKLENRNKILFPRFIQNEYNTKLLNKKISNQNKPYNYKVSINVLKEIDQPGEKLKDIKTILNLSKDSINMLKKNKILRSITYIE
jgi:hypothetical protein